ncbi:hypothetical protein [Candidatus Vondammii sp. HM_W22]|uniref:hypothetical protein n=1 Tax=Candidatus Vondammii sp. HM_W22 TaxID=2687299 RepID=UPI001F143A2E|nr:hypothetical protein [Candidatus Vondammii sp. HM_W22]
MGCRDKCHFRTECPQNPLFIADEWAELLGKRYDVSSVFHIQGQGPIGKALSDALRAKGFGVSIVTAKGNTEVDPIENGIAVEVRSDNIGKKKKGVLVSLVIGDQILNRSYQIASEGTVANSQVTQLNDGDDL